MLFSGTCYNAHKGCQNWNAGFVVMSYCCDHTKVGDLGKEHTEIAISAVALAWPPLPASGFDSAVLIVVQRDGWKSLQPP